MVDETEIDVFLKFPCFLYNPMNVGILMSSSFSKPSLNIWKFLVHIMLKPSMHDFKHDLTTKGDECNCPVVSTFFGIPFLRIGIKIEFQKNICFINYAKAFVWIMTNCAKLLERWEYQTILPVS